MVDAKAFDTISLWVVPDNPSGLSKGIVKNRPLGAEVDAFLHVYGNFETQLEDRSIGGPEGESACWSNVTHYFERDLFQRASRVLIDDYAPQI